MNGLTGADAALPAARPLAPFWLGADDRDAISNVLTLMGWLAAGDTLDSVERAGDGNLNLVLRVRAAGRSAILKQARPWVEKYPDIPAPLERSHVESAFYSLVATEASLAGTMPSLIATALAWHALLIEDLGSAGDATDLYRGGTLGEADLARLIAYLVALHAVPDPAARMPANAAMIALNHEYIFAQPFAPDGADADLAGIARTLGARYTANHGVLLHGDFYPGAWVKSDTGLRVIDAEFCLIGPPEFDLGVMAAHLAMAGAADRMIADLIARYLAAGGRAIDAALMARFAGTEIWRRIKGVAKLPLMLREESEARLLNTARAMMRG